MARTVLSDRTVILELLFHLLKLGAFLSSLIMKCAGSRLRLPVPVLWLTMSSRTTQVYFVRFIRRLALLLSLVVAFGIAWGNWNANEDLYMSLCAGRDVLHGKLGTPDDWSFVTDNKVWVNQGWLGDAVLFFSYKLLRESGPVLVKGLILLGCLIVLLFRCRRLGIPFEIAVVATTFGTLAIAPLWTIRAEIFAAMWFVFLGGLLTAPGTAGLSRCAGSLGMLVFWSNSHGSFILGFAMIGVRALVPLVRRGLDALVHSSVGSSQTKDQPREAERFVETNAYRSDARRWMLTWAISVPAMAFMNPYGVANLQMPFQQVNAEIWTTWVPFLAASHKIRGSFQGGPLSWLAIVPFLNRDVNLSCSAIALPFLNRFRRARHPIQGTVRITEFLIVALVLCLALRWGRAAIFAALALVPSIALLIHFWAEELKGWVDTTASTTHGRGLLWITPVVCLTFLGLVTTAFLERTLPPLVEKNPLLPPSSIAERLFGMYWGDAHRIPNFLKNNSIKGRVPVLRRVIGFPPAPRTGNSDLDRRPSSKYLHGKGVQRVPRGHEHESGQFTLSGAIRAASECLQHLLCCTGT